MGQTQAVAFWTHDVWLWAKRTPQLTEFMKLWRLFPDGMKYESLPTLSLTDGQFLFWVWSGRVKNEHLSAQLIRTVLDKYQTIYLYCSRWLQNLSAAITHFLDMSDQCICYFSAHWMRENAVPHQKRSPIQGCLFISVVSLTNGCSNNIT